MIVRDTHEAIIDRDTFLQAADIIRNRKTVRTDNRQKNENLFYQKIYCGHCGCRLKHEVHTRHSRIDAIYYCPHARPSGGGTCSLHSIKDELLKEQVLRPLQVQVQLIWTNRCLSQSLTKKSFRADCGQFHGCWNRIRGKFPASTRNSERGT